MAHCARHVEIVGPTVILAFLQYEPHPVLSENTVQRTLTVSGDSQPLLHLFLTGRSDYWAAGMLKIREAYCTYPCCLAQGQPISFVVIVVYSFPISLQQRGFCIIMEVRLTLKLLGLCMCQHFEATCIPPCECAHLGMLILSRCLATQQLGLEVTGVASVLE